MALLVEDGRLLLCVQVVVRRQPHLWMHPRVRARRLSRELADELRRRRGQRGRAAVRERPVDEDLLRRRELLLLVLLVRVRRSALVRLREGVRVRVLHGRALMGQVLLLVHLRLRVGLRLHLRELVLVVLMQLEVRRKLLLVRLFVDGREGRRLLPRGAPLRLFARRRSVHHLLKVLLAESTAAFEHRRARDRVVEHARRLLGRRAPSSSSSTDRARTVAAAHRGGLGGERRALLTCPRRCSRRLAALARRIRRRVRVRSQLVRLVESSLADVAPRATDNARSPSARDGSDERLAARHARCAWRGRACPAVATLLRVRNRVGARERVRLQAVRRARGLLRRRV